VVLGVAVPTFDPEPLWGGSRSASLRLDSAYHPQATTSSSNRYCLSFFSKFSISNFYFNQNSHKFPFFQNQAKQNNLSAFIIFSTFKKQPLTFLSNF